MAAKTNLLNAILLIFLIYPPTAGGQAGLPAGERRAIEQLIAEIEGLTGATFIRNGRDYTADAAARFLRGKWRTKKRDVLSVEDFIAKVASHSSTTGEPYRISFSDGRETPLAPFLRTLLRDRRSR